MAKSKTPFLGNLFSNFSKDEGIVNAINQSNIRKQILGLDEAGQTAFNNLGVNPAADTLDNFYKQYGISQLGAPDVSKLASDPWHGGNAGTLLKGYASAHPLKTAAGVGLGLANVSGLMDNDYWGGQALGALAGGLGSKFLGGSFSPMLTMAGGAVGSLFDKLREKQKSANQQQYYRQ